MSIERETTIVSNINCYASRMQHTAAFCDSHRNCVVFVTTVLPMYSRGIFKPANCASPIRSDMSSVWGHCSFVGWR